MISVLKRDQADNFFWFLFNQIMDSNVTYRQIYPDWQIIPKTHATSPLGRPPLAHYALSCSDLLRGNGSSCAKSVIYWPRCPRARGTMMGEKVRLGGSWTRSSPGARGAQCLQRNVKSSSPLCPGPDPDACPGVLRGLGWTRSWAPPSLLAVLCKALPRSAIHVKEVKPGRKKYCTLPGGMGKG